MQNRLPGLRSNLRADNYITHDNTRYVIISDALLRGTAFQAKMRISYDLWRIAMLLDGMSDLAAIRDKAERLCWLELSDETILAAVDQLNEYCLLDNHRYRVRLEETRVRLEREEAKRTISLESSPDPQDLQKQLAQAFTSPLGPGIPRVATTPMARLVKGLVAPHATYAMSGPCAAHAYKTLLSAGNYDLFVILGYNHIYAENRIETLAKDIVSPLGRMAVDHEFVSACLGLAGRVIEPGSIAAHYEHSIDFQIPMLQYILRQQGREAKIAYFILSNIPKTVHAPAALGFRASIDRAAEAIRKAVSMTGRRVCYIASGDFTHHGPYYGDSEVTESDAVRLKAFDESCIQLIMAGRMDDFYRRAISSKHCCVTPVCLLMSCLGADVVGETLCYYSSWDIAGKSPDINTFAAIAFY